MQFTGTMKVAAGDLVVGQRVTLTPTVLDGRWYANGVSVNMADVQFDPIPWTVRQFARCISYVCLNIPPDKCRMLLAENVVVEVEIKQGQIREHVWDQVWIDGHSCGNRCGAVSFLTALAEATGLQTEAVAQ